MFYTDTLLTITDHNVTYQDVFSFIVRRLRGFLAMPKNKIVHNSGDSYAHSPSACITFWLRFLGCDVNRVLHLFPYIKSQSLKQWRILIPPRTCLAVTSSFPLGAWLSVFVDKKNIQFQECQLLIPVLRLKQDHPLCPVQAYEHNISVFTAPPTSSAFLHFSTGYATLITHSQFTAKLRKVLTLVGLPTSKFSGHSFRCGGATYALLSIVVPP